MEQQHLAAEQFTYTENPKMPIIKIHNIETDEVIEREMNSDELAQWETDKSKALS